MKNNKGFTLVELLAVIAILSLLVILALPNVMSMFKEAKKNSFLTECKQIYKTAQNKWMNDSLFKTSEQTYKRCETCSGKTLDLSGRKEIDFYITLNKAGKVTRFFATDGTYQYSYNGDDLLIENIIDASSVSDLTSERIVTISNNKPYVGERVIADTKTINIENHRIMYEPGMTWEDWIDSEYNTYEFKKENRTYTNEYNGNVNVHYMDNGEYGISMKEVRYYCNTNHYLTVYDLIYDQSSNSIVSVNDEITNTINYSYYGGGC